MEPTLSKLDYRFNPRTRVGCDIKITITAPHPTGFNPRTREGCDWVMGVNRVSLCRFQSTHPRGVRQDTEAVQHH